MRVIKENKRNGKNLRRENPEYIKELSKELRKNQTISEEKLWEKLRNKQLCGFRFLRQYVIGRYIADFYCSKAKLVIEIDGSIHNFADQIEYDRIRDEVISMYGIKVIRFTNNQIENGLEEVLATLSNLLTSGDSTIKTPENNTSSP